MYVMITRMYIFIIFLFYLHVYCVWGRLVQEGSLLCNQAQLQFRVRSDLTTRAIDRLVTNACICNDVRSLFCNKQFLALVNFKFEHDIFVHSNVSVGIYFLKRSILMTF